MVGLFGACGPDYCRQERRPLIEDARWSAEVRGHLLDTFGKWALQPVWQARCIKCGRAVTVRLDPDCGEPDLAGEALEEDCRP